MYRAIVIVALLQSVGTLTASDLVYMHQWGTGNILMYDTGTAMTTTVGDTVLNGYCALAAAPVPVPKAGGGTWPAGTIFGLERNFGRLWVIDKSDASLSSIGEDTNLVGSQGLTFSPSGTLYALRDNDEDGEFYQVSTVNGAASYLGYCGVYDLDGLTAFPVDTNIAGFGLARAGDLLACNGGELYHIDPSTLAAAFIGDSAAHQTLDFSPQGVLYSHDFYGGNLYLTTLDPLGDTFLASVGAYVDGMAVIPEPSCLLLLGLAGLFGRRR